MRFDVNVAGPLLRFLSLSLRLTRGAVRRDGFELWACLCTILVGVKCSSQASPIKSIQKQQEAISGGREMVGDTCNGGSEGFPYLEDKRSEKI